MLRIASIGLFAVVMALLVSGIIRREAAGVGHHARTAHRVSMSTADQSASAAPLDDDGDGDDGSPASPLEQPVRRRYVNERGPRFGLGDLRGLLPVRRVARRIARPRARARARRAARTAAPPPSPVPPTPPEPSPFVTHGRARGLRVAGRFVSGGLRASA